jgi:anti-sigma-K factor RskA
MNYEQPERLDALAAEYALGSMRGRARAHFDRLCARLPAARFARQRWEDRLLPLALGMAVVAPGPDSWAAIQRRLAQSSEEPPVQRSRMSAWRWAAAAAIVVIALVVGRFTLQQPEWQLVADIAPANAATQWRVQRTADARRLTIQTLKMVSHAPSTSFELWVLPAGGGTPVSLGVIPESGSLERRLTEAQRALLLTAVNLAVTVEPAGGSPNGLPSGPPIIVAPIARTG